MRYWYVVAALNAETARRASSVLREGSAHGTYAELKTFLLDTYRLSSAERASRLLAITKLGDRRPSEVADEILWLCAGHDPCFLAREVFLRTLPLTVRQVLSDYPTKDLRELARAADCMCIQLAAQSAMATAAASFEEEESADISGVSAPYSAAHRRPTPTRRSPRGNAAVPLKHAGLCFYHRRFGADARNCIAPCSWRSGNGREGPRV